MIAYDCDDFLVSVMNCHELSTFFAEDPFADPGDDATLQETKPEKAPEAAPSGRSFGLR